MKSLLILFAIALFPSASAHAVPLGPAGGMALPANMITIHGCHGSYHHDVRGWHRHGKRCETQRGLVGRAKREKKSAI